MHHICAYFESIDSAVLTGLTALADPAMTVSGDNIQVPEYAGSLIGAIGIGANITRAQLQAPSLRRMLNYEIRPLNVGAEPLSPIPMALFPENPISLDVDEQLQAWASEDAAGASAVFVIVFLADGPLAPINGEFFTVRVTNASTLVANAWTNGALVFDQVLPVGRYGIVGARFESAGLLAFRFVFQGGAERPGGLGGDTASDLEQTVQRFGGLGSWGEFQSTNPPTVDFLSISADTAQVGLLDLVKVG